MSGNRRAAAAAEEQAANAVVPVSPGEVAPAWMSEVDIGADAGAGLNKAGAESFAIPFLKVLQSNSPEVDEAHAKFIKEARPGMILNTVTGELYDGKEGVEFIPCDFDRKQLRWAPRGSGASFRGEVTEAEAARLRADRKLIDHEGRTYFVGEDGKVDDKRCDRLVDTRLHFGLALDKHRIPHQVLFSLTSTQIKKSKLFNSMQRERRINVGGVDKQLPSWANVYKITTVKESNDRGSWYGVHFTLVGPVPSKGMYDAGKAFHEAVQGNKVNVNYAEAAEDAGGGGDAGGGDPDRF